MLGRTQVGTQVSLIPRLPEHLPTIYGWYDYPDFQEGAQGVTYATFMKWYRGWETNEEWVIWSVAVSGSSGLQPYTSPTDTPELVGIASLSQCKAGSSCRGGYIFIVPSHRRKGYGTETALLCAGYAFSARDVNLVQAAVNVDNNVMHRVLERVGFGCAGRMNWFPSREDDIYVLGRDSWQQHEAQQ